VLSQHSKYLKMKKLFTVVLCVFTLIITSCQFSENIYINDDGSGTMTFSVDATELMQMASEMGDGNPQKGLEKAVDSTIVFKDFLEEKKDSIATLPMEDQKKLKALEHYKMHMVINPETHKMTFDLLTDFKSANDLNDIFKAMNSFSNMQGKGGEKKPINPGASPLASMGADGTTKVDYSFENNTFKRTASILNNEKHQQAMDSLGDSAMMFGSSKYTLNYRSWLFRYFKATRTT